MRLMRVIFLFLVTVLTLSHQSDGQQPRPLTEQLRLASVMPRGALLYLQVRDLKALMNRWTSSPRHEAFYTSASFKRFEQSNIYLKFQDRKQDFEKALGFGIDESRLAELAGGFSAIALYDIGNLELAFVTEVGREKAIATTLFKNTAQFEERPAKNGAYYVREVATDGGRLKQQFCFAYAESKLLVTTTEGLMIRALDNIKTPTDDSALTDVLAIANSAKGFSARDVTMWLDQTKLNRNRHFKGYWIYGNVQAKQEENPHDTLASMESGLIDLRFALEGLQEQRWFKLSAAAKPAVLTGEQAAAFLRFAPRTSHLVELYSTATGVKEAAALALFGKDFDATYHPTASLSEAEENSEADDNKANRRAERFSRLDARFDRDVDDAQTKSTRATAVDKRVEPGRKQPTAVDLLTPILQSAASYSTMARGKSEVGRPFVRFERAVVIEMKTPVEKNALEQVVANEMRRRFIVEGIDPNLAWQTEGGVRYLAQSLIEQGAAYAISGKYLVLASSKDYVRDILTNASLPNSGPTRVDGSTEYYAIVRVGDAKPVFDQLMTKLDGKPASSVAQSRDEEGEGQEIKFFSDNISSFVAATAVREMRLQRVSDGLLVAERVAYAW